MATGTEAATAPMPDLKVSVRQLFGFDSDMEVPAYSAPNSHVPDNDPDYRFDKATTLAIQGSACAVTAPDARSA